MVDVGSALGMEVTAQITSMDHPIGRLLGNAHEVAESVACLKGEGPEDTMELVRMQGAALGADVDAVIADGSALDAFAQMCRRQGVDQATVTSLIADPWSVLPRGSSRTTIVAPTSGWISGIDALALGRALVQIGAGRTHPDEALDLGAGIELLTTVGAPVEAGAPLAHIDHNMAVDVPDVVEAFVIGAEAVSVPCSRLLETVAQAQQARGESKRRLWGSNPRPWD